MHQFCARRWLCLQYPLKQKHFSTPTSIYCVLYTALSSELSSCRCQRVAVCLESWLCVLNSPISFWWLPSKMKKKFKSKQVQIKYYYSNLSRSRRGLASLTLSHLHLSPSRDAVALLRYRHILLTFSHPGSGSRWGAGRRWCLCEGLYLGFQWAQILEFSQASAPLLSHEVIQHLLASKWGVYNKWTSGIWYFHCKNCLHFYRSIMQWGLCYSWALGAQRTPVRDVTRRLLCGRKSYLDILRGRVVYLCHQ